MLLPTQATLHTLARMTPNLSRILGQNPGPYTLQGTNTYMLWIPPRRILIDVAEGKPAYVEYLEEECRNRDPYETEPITDIILTHYHHDHTQGLADVVEMCKRLWPKAALPTVHKFPHAQQDPKLDFDRLGIKIENITDGLEWADGTVQFMHTPGHTADSICILVKEPFPYIISADTILGAGTTVFENLSEYLISLRLLRDTCARICSPNSKPRTMIPIYPGHGPMIQDGLVKIDEYITHRLEREAEIFEIIRSAPRNNKEQLQQQQQQQPADLYSPTSLSSSQTNQGVTVEEIVQEVYKGKIPPSVVPAASRGVKLHLEKLIDDGKVVKNDSEDEKHTYSLAQNQV